MRRSSAIVVVLFCVAAVPLLCTIVYGALLSRRIAAVRSDASLSPDSHSALPAAYLVPAWTPAKDQGRRGTCWIFSIMGMLEGSYRKHGIDSGLLPADEYVAFSEQALGIGIVKHCREHPEDRYCFSGPAVNSTADGRPEWIFAMRNAASKYVLPDAVCPYQPHEEHQFTCPGLDNALARPSLKFEIRSIQSQYSIDGIKRLLVEKKVPLAWSHAILSQTFEVPCDDPQASVGDTPECLQCTYPCAKSASGCCAVVSVSGITADGIFSHHGRSDTYGGHAMLLLGYNDDMLVETGLPGKGVRHRGGWIIKNSWSSSIGHSAGYWAGKHSIMEENTICPCETASRTWIPAERVCMAQQKDVVACAPKQEKYVRDRWVKGATPLVCKAGVSAAKAKLLGWNSCDKDLVYVLAGSPERPSVAWTTIPAGSDGYLRFHLIGWNPKNLSLPVVEVETNATTWFGIENILTPKTVLGNSDVQCGIYFMPYETFLEATANYRTIRDTPAVTFVDIKWEDSSFLSKLKSTSPGYDLLKASTHKFPTLNFTGPYAL